MTSVVQIWKVLKYRQDRLEKMLAELRWPLPGNLGAAWMDHVADSYFAGILTAEDVADVILDKYQKHGLQDTRQEWEQDALIAPRLPILLDALSAHEKALYTCSIPVLLAQLEGLIAEAKHHKGIFTGRLLEQYMNPMMEKGSRFKRAAARMAVKTLWSNFYHGDTLPPFSRHAILHGADVRYGTAANSLRAILYFDNIRRALRQLKQ